VVELGRREFELERLEVVVVNEAGGVAVVDLGARRPGQVRRGQLLGEALPLALTDDQLQELQSTGQLLVVDGQRVIGLQVEANGDAREDGRLVAALAEQSINAAPRRAVSWFVLSSALVLLGATLAGIRLARRMVRPVQEIQAATSAIAAGDLDVRVAADGPGELGDLGRSVNRMAEDLRRSRDLEQQFLLSVSHDLRTPLTAISGYAEALEDGAITDAAAAGGVIRNHANRLERLVGDLLDLAKLDADRFTFHLDTVDVAVVAGRTASGLAPEAAQQGISVTPLATGSPHAVADPDRLAQAIGNLVTNAVSFAATAVTVSTSTETDEAQRPLAVITVDDDGPGFAAEDLPHVFERLYTGAARPRRAENPSGLGLSIVRELVSAMGGTVHASNHDGGGARLRIVLPATEPAPVGQR
jgi:two-component system sensor histidine kinase BaeS